MKLDLNLLKRLLTIDHPSKQEWPMLTAIINECYRIPGLEFELDNYSNLLITKNITNPDYYACVVAHTDCVIPHSNKSVKIKDNKITGRHSVTNKQIGLGMDDTVGICCALQLLKKHNNLKVCFTTEEEIGFNGAYEASENIDFFHDVSYFIQADRHGASDLITYTNCIYSASELWLEEATPIMAKYGYSEAHGLGTDIGVLAQALELSGVNISCGYYNEHTDKEYGVISEIENCLNFMDELLDRIPLDKQYEIKIAYHPYNVYNSSKHDFDYYDLKTKEDHPTDEDWIPCNTCRDFDCMNCPYGDWWNHNT